MCIRLVIERTSSNISIPLVIKMNSTQFWYGTYIKIIIPSTIIWAHPKYRLVPRVTRLTCILLGPPSPNTTTTLIMLSHALPAVMLLSTRGCRDKAVQLPISGWVHSLSQSLIPIALAAAFAMRIHL